MYLFPKKIRPEIEFIHDESPKLLSRYALNFWNAGSFEKPKDAEPFSYSQLCSHLARGLGGRAGGGQWYH